MNIPVRLGTRGSPLALTQAHMVARALGEAHGIAAEDVEIVPIRTSGDRIQDRPLAEVGGKALWTKELDRALMAKEIDFAVHSMKDVETIRPAEIAIAAMLPRADVRDRLIGAESIAALPESARVGTSSPRRAAQLLNLRPDLSIISFRGNVDTRLARLDLGEAEATLLAAAGLDRLGRADIGVAIEIGTMLPAPAQGAVGIEARAADDRMIEWLRAIDHAPTSACVRAERALLLALGGDCRSPIAALATSGAKGIHLRGAVYAPDGSSCVKDETLILHGGEPAILARRLLEQSPKSVRALFTG